MEREKKVVGVLEGARTETMKEGIMKPRRKQKGKARRNKEDLEEISGSKRWRERNRK